MVTICGLWSTVRGAPLANFGLFKLPSPIERRKKNLLHKFGDAHIAKSNNPPVLRFKLGDEVYNLDAQNTRFGSRITGTGNKKAVAKDKLQDHLDARGLGKDMDAIMDSTGSFKRREGQGSGPKRGQRKVRRLPL